MTGKQVGTPLVNYSAIASNEEKRAVKELDKYLSKAAEPGTVEKYLRKMEMEEKSKKPTDWVFMCRPHWDVEDESGGPEEESGSLDSPTEHEDGCEVGWHREGHPADDYPGHKWIVTKRGGQWEKYWLSEQWKRDQRAFNAYFYNDWTGYGILEILENQVSGRRLKHALRPR